MKSYNVALFTRAWIEISAKDLYYPLCLVALFTRAWIEMSKYILYLSIKLRRPLHEGVD